jgi:hypothetical protein
LLSQLSNTCGELLLVDQDFHAMPLVVIRHCRRIV